jgi:putative chitinase
MNQITLAQLRAVMPRLSKSLATQYLPWLNQALERFEINTPVRQAAFLGQIAHESGELTLWREIASGRAYEGRADLGNVYPGDGPKYKGGGPMQLTGRANYRKCGRAIGVKLELNPTLITKPEVGFLAAAWFWTVEKRMNALADKNNPVFYRYITRRINGGYNGHAQRVIYWNRAKRVLGV